MAAKENLSPEAYARQTAKLKPYIKYERPTSKSPIRLYQDQDDKLVAIAQEKGQSKSDAVRAAVDFYLQSVSDAGQNFCSSN